MAENRVSITEMHHRKTPHGILVWGTGKNGSEVEKSTSHVQKRSENCPEDDWTLAYIECQKRILEMFHPEEIDVSDDEKLYLDITTVIDEVGFKLAMNNEMPLSKKVEEWVLILKAVLPHIPDEYKLLRDSVQDCIKYPNNFDFMEKPRHY